MVRINRFGFLAHLRADANEHILHFRRGRRVRSGAGLAYWFAPMSAAIALLPGDDGEATFILQERSADLQEVNVQCTVRYRIVEPELVAQRVNFSIALTSGRWIEDPIERLAGFLRQRVQRPVRARIIAMPVAEALHAGGESLQQALDAALADDGEIEAMGLRVVGVQIISIAPDAEVERALQTPTREHIQEKADEAVFARRALAVENERAIKENEMATEIELARQHERLIQQEGDNQLLLARKEAEARAAQVQAEVERDAIAAEGEARDLRTKAAGRADARQLVNDVALAFETRRIEAWRDAPAHVGHVMVLEKLAENLPSVEHLSVTPDMLGDLLQKILVQKGRAA